MTTQSGTLSPLRQQHQLLKIFGQHLFAALPSPLNQHCYVANVRAHTLVIHTDSALWATQLRLRVPELITLWQHDMRPSVSMIEHIEVKVRP